MKTAGTAGRTGGIGAKMCGTAARTAGIAGKMYVTEGMFVGLVGRINGTAAKIDGIAKRMFANLKEIAVSIEGMCPAMTEGVGVVKIISLCY